MVQGITLKRVGYRSYEGTYRDKHVRIWGEHDDGGFGRVRRWWNLETCGRLESRIKDFEGAKTAAREIIDIHTDGPRRPSWRDLFADEIFFADFELPEFGYVFAEAREEIVAEPDKKMQLRRKLEQMTVERGCTEAEAAIAKKKLAEL
jgi:hypothetical protein